MKKNKNLKHNTKQNKQKIEQLLQYEVEKEQQNVCLNKQWLSAIHISRMKCCQIANGQQKALTDDSEYDVNTVSI